MNAGDNETASPALTLIAHPFRKLIPVVFEARILAVDEAELFK